MSRRSLTMRLTKVSRHIWQVHLWRLTSVNVWLVESAQGLTLVDTGFSFMASDILRAAERTGAGPIARVLLTHGHPDHAGGVPLLARRLDVPVLAHRQELPFLTGGRLYPRIASALQPRHPGLIYQLPEAPTGGLRSIGGLTPWPAPGHTPGHVVYYHDADRVLLAGDLFNSSNGRLRHLGHWYSLDKNEATRSEQLLGRLLPAQVETSHGGSVLNPPAAL